MARVIMRRTVLGAAASLAAPPILRSRADEPLGLRCSIDTAPTHERNLALADYLKNLEAAADGALRTEQNRA